MSIVLDSVLLSCLLFYLASPKYVLLLRGVTALFCFCFVFFNSSAAISLLLSAFSQFKNFQREEKQKQGTGTLLAFLGFDRFKDENEIRGAVEADYRTRADLLSETMTPKGRIQK